MVDGGRGFKHVIMRRFCLWFISEEQDTQTKLSDSVIGATAAAAYCTEPTDSDPHRYQAGFGNRFSSETVPGTLPLGLNAPQKCRFDLYLAQLNGSSFLSPRATLQHVCMYRIWPSVAHRDVVHAPDLNPWPQACFSPLNKRVKYVAARQAWDLFPLTDEGGDTESQSLDLVQGIRTILHVYTANKPMTNRDFCNNDGDFMILPQQGRIDIQTDLGWLMVRPGELAVIQAGLRFRIAFPDVAGPVPIGSKGMALPQDFQSPVASIDVVSSKREILYKMAGLPHASRQDHTPFDVAAWRRNLVPCKYATEKFINVANVNGDQADPTVYCVLTAQSKMPGVSLTEFLVFTPKWIPTWDTFRLPYYHRNMSTEMMGRLYGKYSGSSQVLEPGGLSYEASYMLHGGTYETWLDATTRELKPGRIREDTAGFHVPYTASPIGFLHRSLLQRHMWRRLPPCEACRYAGAEAARSYAVPRRGEGAVDRQFRRRTRAPPSYIPDNTDAHGSPDGLSTVCGSSLMQESVEMGISAEQDAEKAAGGSRPRTREPSPGKTAMSPHHTPARQLQPTPDIKPSTSLPLNEEIAEGCRTFVTSYFQLGFIPKAMFQENLARDPLATRRFLQRCMEDSLDILPLNACIDPSIRYRHQSHKSLPRAFFLLAIAEWSNGDKERSSMDMGVAVRVATLLRLYLEETYALPPTIQVDQCEYNSLIYEQVEAFFSIRTRDKGFPAILVFCVYIHGSISSYLWRHPYLFPHVSPSEAEEMALASLRILSKLHQAWSTSTRWQQGLQLFASPLSVFASPFATNNPGEAPVLTLRDQGPILAAENPTRNVLSTEGLGKGDGNLAEWRSGKYYMPQIESFFDGLSDAEVATFLNGDSNYSLLSSPRMAHNV
ncbi:homogentisate 1,2-dioxygenase [Colletotrichum orchidophilum]|uniref:homogentisate 1,2-dioxygenase n=1 Tax=Colletotrichum orchidophilum TaxID=1209926 RepID=A0A1G4AWP7_9PEZI|nr:homogentisate 1,2-dioxygenase [Colletotrichum orchidophilum]OHE93536.1 homogentisate 1,2-dioxygenase [Colletotrichum orchidophilum]